MRNYSKNHFDEKRAQALLFLSLTPTFISDKKTRRSFIWIYEYYKDSVIHSTGFLLEITVGEK